MGIQYLNIYVNLTLGKLIKDVKKILRSSLWLVVLVLYSKYKLNNLKKLQQYQNK